MFAAEVHADRRRRLRERVDGPLLLVGNGERARNLPMTKLPFRQDSTFLYFTGCQVPGAALLMDGADETLFLPSTPADDALWHGPQPSPFQQGTALGFDRVQPLAALDSLVRRLQPRTLAVPDEQVNTWLAQRLGTPLAFGRHAGDEALMDAVIAMRRVKGPEELDALRSAAEVTRAGHVAAMSATRPGSTEQALAALFTGVLAARGHTPGYAPILTVRGEILHNHDHGNPLEAGQLVLLDGGAEGPHGYTCDVTRTWPVSGRFDARQRATYEAVLEAQAAAIAACTPGTRYRHVHDTACRVLAQFLVDEGLLRGSVDDALATHAHALFYPHGTGHHLGLDVHDLENFGDRSSYPEGQGRPEPFGTRNLRLDLPLEPDWVVTVEPGLYLVPTILADGRLRERFAEQVDWDRATSWLGFGGIRIEDDVRITEAAPEVITESVPRSIEAIEAVVGSGPSAEERLR